MLPGLRRAFGLVPVTQAIASCWGLEVSPGKDLTLGSAICPHCVLSPPVSSSSPHGPRGHGWAVLGTWLQVVLGGVRT